MVLRILVAVFLLVITISRVGSHGSETSGLGELNGKVVRGPTSPVVGKDTPPPLEPAPGVRLEVLTPAGEKAGSVVTDVRGTYRLSLPPGNYRVETNSLTGIEFTRDLPTTVVIHKNQQTRLDILIDTGIR